MNKFRNSPRDTVSTDRQGVLYTRGRHPISIEVFRRWCKLSGKNKDPHWYTTSRTVTLQLFLSHPVNVRYLKFFIYIKRYDRRIEKTDLFLFWDSQLPRCAVFFGLKNSVAILLLTGGCQTYIIKLRRRSLIMHSFFTKRQLKVGYMYNFRLTMSSIGWVWSSKK